MQNKLSLMYQYLTSAWFEFLLNYVYSHTMYMYYVITQKIILGVALSYCI